MAIYWDYGASYSRPRLRATGKVVNGEVKVTTTMTYIHAETLKRKITLARETLLAAGIIANDGSGDSVVESLIYDIAKLANGSAIVGDSK